MASFRQRNGKWEYRIRVKTPSGYKEKSKGGFKTQKEAKQSAREVESQIYHGVNVISSDILIGDYLRYFLESHKKGFVAENTYIGYESAFRVHIEPYFRKTKLKDLNRSDYTKLLRKLLETRKLKTVATINVYFNEAINYAVYEEGILPKNPITRIKFSKLASDEAVEVENEVKCFELNELNNFLDASSKHTGGYKYYILFTFLSRTGLRIGEALALQWSSIDFEKQTVSVTKTLFTKQRNKPIKLTKPKTRSSVREIAVDENTLLLMKRWKTEQMKNILKFGKKHNTYDFVFTNEDNYVLMYDAVKRFMERLCEKHKIRYIKPHGLRHTHAVHLLQSGADLKTVSKRLGHTTIDMTANVYLHVLKSMEDKAIDNYTKFLNNVGNSVGNQ